MKADTLYIDYKEYKWFIVAQGRMINMGGQAGRQTAYHHVELNEDFAENPPKRTKRKVRTIPYSRYQ